MFLNVFAGFVNLGKSEKQRKLWPIFLKKSKCLNNKRKEKKINLSFSSALFSKVNVKDCKGVRSMDFI